MQQPRSPLQPSAPLPPPPLPPPARAGRASGTLALCSPSCLQCSFVKPAAAVQSHRWLSTTPSDEFNREMAALFGAPPGGDKPQGAGAAAAAAAEVASSSGGQLMSDVQDFNAELSGVLGAASEHEGNDASAAAAASSLSRQLAAAGGSAAGRAATPPSRPTSTSSSGGNCSIAGPYGSFAGSSSGSSSSDAGGRLTHVDAAGKAAMVDVSHVSGAVRQPASCVPHVLRCCLSQPLGLLTPADLCSLPLAHCLRRSGTRCGRQ